MATKAKQVDRKGGKGARLRTYIGVAISGLCLWWIIGAVEGEELLAQLRGVNVSWLLLAVATTFVSYLVRSVRWPFFFGEGAPSFPDSFRCLIVGFFMNNILPARIGELVRAHLGGKATGQSRSTVLATIAGERLADGLMISLLFAILFTFFSAPYERERAEELYYVSYLFLAAGVVTALILFGRNRIFAVLEGLKVILPGRAPRYALIRIRRFITGLEPLLKVSRLLVLSALSVAVWLIELAVYYQVTQAFNMEMSLGGLGLFLAAVNFSSLIPAAPGGIGVIEAFASMALIRIGIGAETAIAMVGTQHLIQYIVVGIPGGLYFLRDLKGKIPEKEREKSEPEEAVNESEARSIPDFSNESPVPLLDVSIVLPAYNEEQRLGRTLDSILAYFSRRNTSFEILVVDDGSTDGTIELVRRYELARPEVRLLSYPNNRGKGYAVRYGVMNARGKRILFNDADGATPIEEIERLEAALDEGAQVAIGSRAMFSGETSIKTVWYRKAIGRVFNGIVNVLLLPDIADTQCGFKMFTRRAARSIFSRQQADGFSFDVEILFLARKGGYLIVEVPINWTNVPGSKVNLVKDSAMMFLDLLRFRTRDLFGGYRDLTRYDEQLSEGQNITASGLDSSVLEET